MQPPLKLEVASPCSQSWEAMQGDERVRHCQQCRLNVYNLSAMTRSELLELVSRREGRVCGRFYQRKDGTVITRDCPRSVRAAFGWVGRRSLLALGLALAVCLTGLVWAGRPFGLDTRRLVRSAERLFERFNPVQVQVLGEICPPPGPPPTQQASRGG